MKDSVWWQLLRVFVPLSLISVGGGQSVLYDIQNQTVVVHHWLTSDQFLDAFGIARASPGPNTMIVTFIGWQAAGFGGAIVATLAIFLPSAILFYGMTVLWRMHAFNHWRDRVARGLAPVAAGLVFAGTYSVLVANGKDPWGWGVTAASLALLTLTRVSPLILLAAGAAIFWIKAAVGI